MSKSTALKILGGVLFVAAAVIVVLFSYKHAHDAANQPKLATPNGHVYNLLVAETAAEQAKGLGGRSSLPQNEAMIFPFTSEGTRCFWMKNMKFSLDMVWTNSQRQVVAVVPNVSPKTYPKTFCAQKPAQYVIELNAGQAKAADIVDGKTLNF